MRWHLATLAFSLLPATLVLAQTATPDAPAAPAAVDLSKDPQLAKPVTVHLAMASLPAALKEMSKAAGTKIEAASNMSGRKVTLLVKDVPLSTVMARMAEVFHGDWKKYDTGYSLLTPAEYVHAEDDFRDDEAKERRKPVEDSINELAKTTRVSYDQIKADLAGGKASAEEKRVATPEVYLLGRMLGGMNSTQKQAFWNGEPMRTTDTLVVNNAGANDQAPRPGVMMGRRGRMIPATGGVVRQPVVAFVIYNPFLARVSSSDPQMSAITPAAETPFPTDALGEKPFAKEAYSWIYAAEPDTFWNKPISTVSKSTWYEGRHALSDYLVALHDSTGIPVVADAFRVPIDVANAGSTLGTMVAGLAQQGTYMRFDHGFLMAKTPHFWRYRKSEVPEEKFAPIEKAGTGVDDFATFAAGLTPEQLTRFRGVGLTLMRVDPRPLVQGLPALRFYATLSEGQKSAARAGSPVLFSQLGGTSRETFLVALNDFSGQRLGSGMFNLNSPTVDRNLGFTFQAQPSDMPGSTTRINVNMLFGTSQSQGVQYRIPLP